MSMKYNTGDSVKFFDGADVSIPTYGVVVKQTKTKVIVDVYGEIYHLRNNNDHIHQLNYN